MIIVTHPLFVIITLTLYNLLAKLFNPGNKAASTFPLVRLVVRRKVVGRCLRVLLAIPRSVLDAHLIYLKIGMPIHHTTNGIIP
jgi:hypothetical protein